MEEIIMKQEVQEEKLNSNIDNVLESISTFRKKKGYGTSASNNQEEISPYQKYYAGRSDISIPIVNERPYEVNPDNQIVFHDDILFRAQDNIPHQEYPGVDSQEIKMPLDKNRDESQNQLLWNQLDKQVQENDTKMTWHFGVEQQVQRQIDNHDEMMERARKAVQEKMAPKKPKYGVKVVKQQLEPRFYAPSRPSQNRGPLSIGGEGDAFVLILIGGNGEELLRMDKNGDIYVKGNLASIDAQVVDAMRNFLKANKYHP